MGHKERLLWQIRAVNTLDVCVSVTYELGLHQLLAEAWLSLTHGRESVHVNTLSVSQGCGQDRSSYIALSKQKATRASNS